MRIYYYPSCSTCKKALKWLDNNEIAYEKKHIVDAKLTTKEIEDIFKKSGLPIQKLFNTSGRVYKELNLKDKLKDMTEKEKLELLASDGMLLKRPILVNRTFALIGFKEDEYKEKLV
ncbi:arsenate reductase family protein [Pseudoleptotrichia goodfellowii]|jgi:transcriptional regulator, spx/mgsR family|uniref:Transcriptional regulator, Spx/MgsR family n=2 Tax=Pseudoleptotrichia goodfellowii TaxID=157692 RepID=D0GLP4_9FUSO|nr:arsenate reductase family protein [Pseudoleptotrichia goodfellowii]EEY35001.1 transcriptional regulator, Spx/MgsR family [Pseudoleptotrichia goodfellowii F0264]BBM36856.1 arsenate reductase-like protein [Pseudoleptotrichia goodfellowii]